MQLSNHFSLEEFTRSEIAARKGISNSPPPSIITNMHDTANRMEIVRSTLGNKPITIFSCYRSPRVNTAVGGSHSSSHLEGRAVDFVVAGLSIRKIIDIIESTDLSFDQLIDEFNSWVHIGFGSKMRRQILSARKKSGTTIYTEI